MNRAHHNDNSNAAPPGTTLPSNRNQYHSKEELPVSDRLAPYRPQSHSNVSVNNDEIYILETASHDNIDSLHDIDTPVYNHTTTRQGQDTFVPSSNTPSNETSLPSPTSPTDTTVPVPRKKQTHAPTPQTRWKALRLRVMRLATVRRLQLLWGLLALFGFMSWLALMPAYAFRNKLTTSAYTSPTYTLFLVATVGTTISAIWQSLSPFLIRRSQRDLMPRIINHPVTQTTTIVVSVILTILNFFSWIILASNTEAGAKTDCHTGPLSNRAGYTAQCRGVNTAIVLDVVVFLLWIPIALVIVCGTLERGLWWWGEDDGAHALVIARGSNMMSEEEFDLKIGAGRRAKANKGEREGDGQEDDEEEEIQRPRLAYVTPIASQFQSGQQEQEGDEEEIGFSPSRYRKHQQQAQAQQRAQAQAQKQGAQLQRKSSNTSLTPSFSGRLSTFFGAGWGHGPMPPAPPETPVPQVPDHHRQKSRLGEEHSKPSSEVDQELERSDVRHGESYATQWHSRRDADWS
ncbi:hypothetical protein BGZ74_011287 [Mortierella antarctica]|nr:hypothetical protein BGZ74_011287 [Mortierella antarctica]